MRCFAIFAVLALVGCGEADVLDTPLSEIDFADHDDLQGVAQRLNAQDRRVFIGYALTRAAFPGLEPLDPDGTEPDTVRDVIAAMREINALDDERNALVEQKNALPETSGPEWDRLDSEIAVYDRKLDELRGK